MQLSGIRNLVLLFVGVVLFSVLSITGSFAADKPKSISAKMSSEASSPIHVIGRLSLVIPDEDQNEYNKRTAKLFELTNTLDHPILYTCNQDVNDAETFVWDEEWTSYQQLQDHLNSDHFNEWWNYSKQFLKGELDVQYAKISDFHKV